MEYLKEEFPLPDDFKFKLWRSSGRIRCMHCHDCLEIDYVESGTGTYVVEGKSYDVKPGDFIIINNSERHMIIPDEDYAQMTLIFDLDFIWKHINEYSYLNPFFNRNAHFSNRIRKQDEFYQELYDCMDKISFEYAVQEEGWQVMVRSCLIQIIVNLYRHYEKHQELDEKTNGYQSSYEKLRPVLDYIHEHFREPLSLEILAEEAAISKNYLCAYFKKTLGVTIFEYIEQERINYCSMLLDTTDLSITDIALRAGFNSVSYFNRIFKRLKGNSPRQYRKHDGK